MALSHDEAPTPAHHNANQFQEMNDNITVNISKHKTCKHLDNTRFIFALRKGEKFNNPLTAMVITKQEIVDGLK